MPTNLRRGINIPFVFGNAEYYRARYADFFNANRLRTLLEYSDFVAIKNANPTNPTFDHVRIPIDPWCFNVGADGSVPATNMFDDTTAIYALRETITEATSAGLAVVIAFHAGALNLYHYNKANVSPPLTPPIYKLSFITNEPPTAAIPDTHPLVRFWETLAPYLADFDKSKVYLSLCDEPLVSYENKLMFDDEDEPPNYNNEIPEFLTDAVMKSHRKNWRNIQLKVIQKLRSHSNTNVRNFWLIASTYTGQANDIDGWEGQVGEYAEPPGPGRDVKPGMVDPRDVKPYSYAEVPEAKIIYGFSFYHPMRYTHWNWTKRNQPTYYADPGYLSGRDFLGIAIPDNETPEIGPRKPAEDQSVSNWWYTYDRSMERMLIELADFQTVEEDFGNGLSAEYWVPMYIAGFGSTLRQITMAGTEEDPGGDPQWGGDKFDDKYRKQWYFDARKGFEQRGFGWATWEIFGGHYRIWSGRLSAPGNYNARNPLPVGWGAMDTEIKPSFFGNDRPTQ